MKLPASAARFRLLLVGAGMIGREHIRVSQLLGKAVITGIHDSHQASIDAALLLFDEAQVQRPVVFDSLADALAESGFDGVMICTPNYTHYALIQQVAKTGLPLFVEKPMATNLKEAARIVELADDYPGFIQLGMQYRYKSQYSEAFREVRENRSLGAVKTISMSEYRPPFLDKVDQWNKFNEFSGGTLVEKCCHYFDLINLMADSRPLSVMATGGQAVNFLDFEHNGKASDIHDHGYVIINYENGVHASFTLNMFSQELYEELVVAGENGRLIATEHSSFNKPGSTGAIKVETPGHESYASKEVTYPEIIERSGHHGSTFFEHEALVSNLAGEVTDSATAIQGMWAIIVASAAQESVQTQSIIPIEEYLQQNDIAWFWNRSGNP